MKIAKVDAAINICRDFLEKTNSNGTEIESYLTRYLTILICAEFEQAIKNQIVGSVSNKFSNEFLRNYVSNTLERIFRSLRTSEISGLLNAFSSDMKENFSKLTLNSPESISFNNIVVNRHTAAHEDTINLTFNELVENYEKAHSILDHIEKCFVL